MNEVNGSNNNSPILSPIAANARNRCNNVVIIFFGRKYKNVILFTQQQHLLIFIRELYIVGLYTFETLPANDLFPNSSP